jgi:hypothetical protein
MHPPQLYSQRSPAYVRTSSLCYTIFLLTPPPVAQRWQQKACKAPFRNTGPITQRVGIALVTLAGICVVLRFVSRWQIKDSAVGWDDWTILVSFILLIPSTIKLAESASLFTHCALVSHTDLTSSGRKWHGSGYLDCPVRQHYPDVQGTSPWGCCGTNLFKHSMTDHGFTQTFWAEQYIYIIIVVLTKVSIVLLYLVSPTCRISIILPITNNIQSVSSHGASQPPSHTPAGL